jgi:phosphatidylglycerophosphate synthase
VQQLKKRHLVPGARRQASSRRGYSGRRARRNLCSKWQFPFFRGFLQHAATFPFTVPYDRRPLKARSLGVIQTLAKKLADFGVGPNKVSLAGLAAAVAGFVCLWGAARGWPFAWFFVLLAAVFVQLRLLCNVLDGILAIEFDRREKAGDIYNEIPDRLEDTLFFVGAGYVAGSAELGWSAAVLAVFTAYVRAFGGSLGQVQDYGGPCSRTQRMGILTAGLVAAVIAYFLGMDLNVVKITLWILVIGTAATAVLRIARLYRLLP